MNASRPFVRPPVAGNQAAQRQLRSVVQTKLTVNEPGDVYEQEAERVADEVMRMPAQAAGPPQIQRMCADCEEEKNH